MKKKRKLLTIKVPGHWVIPDVPGKRAYYVPPYEYTRESTKGKKREPTKGKKREPTKGKKREPTKGKKREPTKGKKREPTPPEGYVLDKHYEIIEREGRVVYTYKIEALVEYQGRYLMEFSMDKALRGQRAIEYYHTHFEPTIEAATADLHEQMLYLQALGHIVKFLSIDLYRVAGEGPITQQNWTLLKSYDDIGDVPKE
jgi:hypothetical protein